jgi:hypothetical protein
MVGLCIPVVIYPGGSYWPAILEFCFDEGHDVLDGLARDDFESRPVAIVHRRILAPVH